MAAVFLAAAALAAAAAVPAAASDGSATRAYLTANLKLARTAAGLIPRARTAIDGVAAHIRADCPAAAAQSPQNPQSTQLSNELIGAMVISAYHIDVPGLRRFVAAASGLRWSSGALTATVRAYVAHVRTLAELGVPDVCGDVRAWRASGYRALPAATAAFSPRFMEAWVGLGEVPPGMGRFATGPLSGLVRAAAPYESALSQFEANEVETWGHMMDVLELSP